jgi:hypothetical protein
VEAHVDRIHTEKVVLDIGQDTGALIIYTEEGLRGKEIEVSERGRERPRTHTDVAARRFRGKLLHAAVFPELPAGEYTIWGAPRGCADAVWILGGAVAEVDWTGKITQ